jgi:hypothetical protein
VKFAPPPSEIGPGARGRGWMGGCARDEKKGKKEMQRSRGSESNGKGLREVGKGKILCEFSLSFPIKINHVFSVAEFVLDPPSNSFGKFIFVHQFVVYLVDFFGRYHDRQAPFAHENVVCPVMDMDISHSTEHATVRNHTFRQNFIQAG